MIVLSVPLRLRISALLLFLCIPLIAAQIVIVNQSVWWNLPLRKIGYWVIAYSFICIPIVSWIFAGKKWALYLGMALAGIWVLSSAALSIRMGLPALAFFSIFLLMYLTLVFSWIWVELRRSFFDPQLAWYQGLPRPIPGLVCHLARADHSIEFKVSRFDVDGIFIFRRAQGVDQEQDKILLSELATQKRLIADFEVNSMRLQCPVRVVSLIHRGMGMGLQFVELSSDLEKDVRDFVEALRGKGYV